MTEQNEILKQVFKDAGARVYKLVLLNSILVVETQSYNACTKCLQIARALGCEVTHGAQPITLSTNPPLRGYRFMAGFEDFEKIRMVACAKIILDGLLHSETIIKALIFSKTQEPT